jgi:hypothetical protein
MEWVKTKNNRGQEVRCAEEIKHIRSIHYHVGILVLIARMCVVQTSRLWQERGWSRQRGPFVHDAGIIHGSFIH